MVNARKNIKNKSQSRSKSKPIKPAKKTKLAKEAKASTKKGAWKNETKNLQEQSFATVDEAVEAIIGQVLGRLKVRDEATVRAFLQETLGDDPTISGELKRLLKIRN